MQEIEARAENATDVLLEVNIGSEESKSGVPLEEVDAFLEAAAACPKARFAGLMCMPPLFDDAEEARPFFSCGRASWPNGFLQSGAERILSTSYRWVPAPTTKWPSKKG